MNIDELTVGEAKKLVQMFGITKDTDTFKGNQHPYKIGEIYLVRTVTMIQCGRLSWVGEQEIVLTSASWIADTGRFHKALISKDELAEVEPFPEGEVIVGRGAIVDAVIPEWTELPKKAK